MNFIEEGHFLHGNRNGYSRNISAVDGQVELGFYKNDLLEGKGCIYQRIKPGQPHNYVQLEGLFRNDKLVEDKAVPDYLTNWH